MKLKPSQRPKKRYIVFEMSTRKDKRQIENSLKKIAKAITNDDTKMKVCKQKNNKVIARIALKHAKSFTDAMNKGTEFKSVGMSGILRVAERKFLAG